VNSAKKSPGMCGPMNPGAEKIRQCQNEYVCRDIAAEGQAKQTRKTAND
jgi:hypothetical protein